MGSIGPSKRQGLQNFKAPSTSQTCFNSISAILITKTYLDLRLKSFYCHFSLTYLLTLGLIFVVDSNDRERVGEAREELMRMLNEDELRDAVLLVFANKQVTIWI